MHTDLEAPPQKRRQRARLEMAVLCGCLLAANLTLFADDPGFLAVAPHPTLLIALVVVARYGLAAGLEAAAACALTHAVALVILLPQLRHVSALPSVLVPPQGTPLIVLLPAVVLIGTLVERHLRVIAEARRAVEDLLSNHLEAQSEQDRLREVNDALAGRLLHADVTVLSVYRHAKGLSSRDAEEIFRATLQMLRETLGVTDASIWRLDNGMLRLAAREEDGVRASTSARDPSLLHDVAFDEQGLFSLHGASNSGRAEHRPSTPLMAAQLTEGANGPVVAYLTVDAMPLLRLRPEVPSLFGTIVQWTSMALGIAAELRKPLRDAGAGVVEQSDAAATFRPLEQPVTRLVRVNGSPQSQASTTWSASVDDASPAARSIGEAP